MKSIADMLLDPRVRAQNAPRTHFEEQMTPYLKFIAWDNTTLESDLRLFWVTLHRYNRVMPSGSLERLLKWVQSKGNMHPKQVIKALNGAITKRNAPKQEEELSEDIHSPEGAGQEASTGII